MWTSYDDIFVLFSSRVGGPPLKKKVVSLLSGGGDSSSPFLSPKWLLSRQKKVFFVGVSLFQSAAKKRKERKAGGIPIQTSNKSPSLIAFYGVLFCFSLSSSSPKLPLNYLLGEEEGDCDEISIYAFPPPFT